MPRPIRIVVYFDDGTQQDIPVRGMSSVFFDEPAAVRCGHRPPYNQGPPPGVGNSGASNGGTNGDAFAATSEGGSCYWINGVIVCP